MKISGWTCGFPCGQIIWDNTCSTLEGALKQMRDFQGLHEDVDMIEWASRHGFVFYYVEAEYKILHQLTKYKEPQK